MSSTSALAGVPGVPETLLTEALLATLPAASAPAPWSCRCDAVVWFGRGGRAATAALAPALREQARGLVVVAGIARYRESPVGPYDEVVGVVGSWTGSGPWGSVAFMAVDSPASMVGGRANWAMPKTLAAFEGAVAAGATCTARGRDGLRWRVAASSRVIGAAATVGVAGRVRQAFPDGRVGASRLVARGRVRPALVSVEVDSEGPLTTWLRPGRHLGAVVEDVAFTLR